MSADMRAVDWLREQQAVQCHQSADYLEKLEAKNARLQDELERERMRLAACGVVALSNTPESAAKQRDMHPDYMSASCQDVMRAVDREMEHRAEVARLKAVVDTEERRVAKCLCNISRLESEVARMREALLEAQAHSARLLERSGLGQAIINGIIKNGMVRAVEPQLSVFKADAAEHLEAVVADWQENAVKCENCENYVLDYATDPEGIVICLECNEGLEGETK